MANSVGDNPFIAVQRCWVKQGMGGWVRSRTEQDLFRILNGFAVRGEHRLP